MQGTAAEHRTPVKETDDSTVKLRATVHADNDTRCLLETLKEAGILDDPQVDEAARDMVPACKGDPRILADELRRAGWITELQAQHSVQWLKGDPTAHLTIGPYVLLDKLGDGGMGEVYKAVHRRLNRLVGLKVLRPELLRDTEAITRFQREARAVALLSHPNIVTLYDAGEVDDLQFLAMEYVSGPDLSRVVKENGPLSVAEAWECMRQTALGLQHAFDMGIVHRDIKPSNLLVVDPAANTRTASRPQESRLPNHFVIKILDMGLARLADSPARDNAEITQEGRIFGTPDYMAPEQAHNPHDVDIRCDLYSLGCTAYFLLAGKAPFAHGATAIEKLLMHQIDEPAPIESLRPDVPRGLASVIARLMSKRPDDRYPEPAALLKDLDRVPALPGSTAKKVVPAPRNGDDSTSMDLPRVRTVAAAPAGPPSAPRIAELSGHDGWVTALAFSGDRNRLASGGMDGRVNLWGFSRKVSPRESLALPRHAEVHSVAFAPDAQMLAAGAGSQDGTIWLWKTPVGGAAFIGALQGHHAPINTVEFSPNGKILASSSCDQTIRLWDALSPGSQTPVVLKTLSQVQSLAFSPDGHALAAGSQDGTLAIWKLGMLWNRQSAVLQGHAGSVVATRFSSDGHMLASAGADRSVKLWDLSGAMPSALSLERHQAGVSGVQFTPDDRRLVSVDAAGHVICWDLATREPLLEWQLHSNAMACSQAYTGDARYLATGRSNGSILIHRLPLREQDPASAKDRFKTS